MRMKLPIILGETISGSNMHIINDYKTMCGIPVGRIRGDLKRYDYYPIYICYNCKKINEGEERKKMKYPKIQSLWKRDPDNKFVILEGVYAKPIFEHIDRWVVSEKIHGMNIRVMYEYSPGYKLQGVIDEPHEMLKFGGRTDNAQLPVFLYEKLMELFDKEKMRRTFVEKLLGEGLKPTKVILFGEGFGNRIQRGGDNYVKDGVDFALFDVYVFESNPNRGVRGWWLNRDVVKEIAGKLGIKVVHELGNPRTKEEIINRVKNKTTSWIAHNHDHIAEGIVARADPPILFRNGHPVMFKLKVEDYEKLEARK